MTSSNRRGFLKTLAVSGALLPLSSCAYAQFSRASRLVYSATKDDSPIAPVALGESSSQDFNGDDIMRPHDLLWNIDGYLAKKGGVPPQADAYDFVVVGGGISGLLSAYYLRKNNPGASILVLEQDSRFGGNSKGENFNSSAKNGSSTYSIGAAYIIEPEPKSEIADLLKDLGLDRVARAEIGSDLTVRFGGHLKNFWKGDTSPQAKMQFAKVRARLQDIGENENLEFGGKLCRQLDGLSFSEWLTSEFGELHPHLLEFFQLYGWSSFAGSIEELSAFQFLNFICFEFGKILAFPGGNSAIAQALVKSLRRPSTARSAPATDAVPSNVRLESGAMVLRVNDEGPTALIVYEEALGTLKTARARKVVMACPKFVAAKLLPQLPSDQVKAISSLRYRAYLVGNVVLKKKVPSSTFDLFDLRGRVPVAPSAMKTGDRAFSDLCFGSWAQHDDVENSVLTLYSGLAYDGARQFLFNPGSHDKHKARMLNDLEAMLPTLGLSKDDILGVRMTRWGHALPLAAQNLISNGTVQLAANPLGKTIFFANQDNWANPAFESAHQAALEATN